MSLPLQVIVEQIVHVVETHLLPGKENMTGAAVS